MTESIKAAALAAFLDVLDPLVRLMLSAGIGTVQAEKYVRIAYGRRLRNDSRNPRKPNISDIAVRTGLTRAKVRELLKTLDSIADEDAPGRQRAERVLAKWWTDRDFTDDYGRAAILPLRDGPGSFEELVRRWSGSGEQRAKPVLKELVRVNAARLLPHNRVEPLSREYATTRWTADGLATLGQEIRDHLETALHNLTNPSVSRALFARRVINSQLNPDDLPVLKRDIVAQLDSVAIDIDTAINHPGYTVKPALVPQRTVRFGVGLYLIEREDVVEPVSPAPQHRPKRRRQRKAAGSARR
jgi:hypothetical protein